MTHDDVEGVLDVQEFANPPGETKTGGGEVLEGDPTCRTCSSKDHRNSDSEKGVKVLLVSGTMYSN